LTLVVAEGALLEQAIHSTFSADSGLNADAYRQRERAQSRTAWGRSSRRRLALLAGSRLIASAVQHDLRAVYQGEPIRVCGLGSVIGVSAARADDRLRQLVERIVERSRGEGAAMVLLVAPRRSEGDDTLPGFVSVPLTDLTLEVAQPLRYGAPMTMVRAGEDRDLPAIAAMGRVSAAPFRLHLDRDVDLIKYAITTKRLLAGLSPAQARQLQFFIAEEGTTAAAYVVLTSVGRAWTLEECGDRDPAGARVGALLQALIAREPAEQRPTISAWLPAGFRPPQVTVAATTEASHVLMLRDLRSASPLTIGADEVLFWRNDVLS
jgi:hypothetical protein